MLGVKSLEHGVEREAVNLAAAMRWTELAEAIVTARGNSIEAA